MSPDIVGPTEPVWDLDRPAIPDDLFRDPVDEPQGPLADDLFEASTPTDPEATVVRPAPPPVLPSPAWAYRPGTPEADLLPSELPYAASQPPVSRPARGGSFSGSRGVLILLVLLVVAAIVGGIVWFTGGGAPTTVSTPSKSAPTAASSRASASASRTPTSVESATTTPSAAPSDAFPPPGAALCAGSTNVAVNAATSCGFAFNVAAAIPTDASGTFSVTASSPTTNKDYQMACVRGTYTVCTGGVNALVYVK